MRHRGRTTKEPLAHHRLKPGQPKASEPSRHARYRRRHPDYREREAARLRTRRTSSRACSDYAIVAAQEAAQYRDGNAIAPHLPSPVPRGVSMPPPRPNEATR
jgi:hypothetical protein